MSKFFIGCRVKKARGVRNVGLTGVVVGTEFVSSGRHSPCFGYTRSVRLDRNSDIQIQFDTGWFSENGLARGSHEIAFGVSEEFEPILPEGAQSSSWEECAWNPSMLKEEETCTESEIEL